MENKKKPRIIHLTLPLDHYFPKSGKVSLSLNSFIGKHWSYTHKIKKAYTAASILPRLWVYKHFKDKPPIEEFHITYQFCFKDKKVKDPSNYWGVISKFLLDALVKEGYIKDDGHKHDKGLIQLPTIYGNKNAVEIFIEEI